MNKKEIEKKERSKILQILFAAESFEDLLIG